MSGGPLVWAAHFAILYGLNTLACAQGFAAGTVLGIGVVPFGVAAATLLAGAMDLAILAIARVAPAPARSAPGAEETEGFLRHAAAAGALLSLLAVGWNALPAFLVNPC
jgi:hypothetical protein